MPRHMLCYLHLTHHVPQTVIKLGVSCLQIGSRAERMGLKQDDIYIYDETFLQQCQATCSTTMPQHVL